MLTFQDQYEMAQQITGEDSASQLVFFKRDINEGAAMFLNRLGRKFNKQYKNTSLVADQQYYQFPSDVIRISEISITIGSFVYHPDLIVSEEEWILLNQTSVVGDYPMCYYIRGFNEVGIYPIPATNAVNALRVSYEPQHVEMTEADFTDGTVTVTNGSAAVTHSGTGFTASMVGRSFQGPDNNWYKVASYNSTSSLELENYYQGASTSGGFRIGETTKVPQGYQDAPVFYALDRYYLQRGNPSEASLYQARFEMKIKSARETYGRSTSRYGVKTSKVRKYRPWHDAPPAISYP